MKTCTKCGETKDFNEFNKNKSKKDGYQGTCKVCISESNKKLKQSSLLQLEKAVRSSIFVENKTLFKEGKKICPTCNNIYLITEIRGCYCLECMREREREYYKKNTEKIRERNKEYNKKNPERKKRYLEQNKERFKEYRKEYNKQNEEYRKEYNKKNKEKINERQRQYRLKLKEGI